MSALAMLILHEGAIIKAVLAWKTSILCISIYFNIVERDSSADGKDSLSLYGNHWLRCKLRSSSPSSISIRPIQYNDSIVLMLVVPTGMIVLLQFLIKFSMHDILTTIVSECISCSPIVSDDTGRNVPAPTCNVTSSKAMPSFLSLSIN